MLKTKRFDLLYYHFSKEMIKKVFNQNRIKYCTNANCPNKLHSSNIATVLTEKDLDYNIMMQYRDILLSLKVKNNNRNNRFDKTMSYLYKLNNMLNNMQVPYCDDCLCEYNPELFSYIDKNILMY